MANVETSDKIARFLEEARQIVAVGGMTPTNLAKINIAADKHGLTRDEREAAMKNLVKPSRQEDPRVQAFTKEALPYLKKQGVLTPRVLNDLAAIGVKKQGLDEKTVRDVVNDLALENDIHVIDEEQAIANVTRQALNYLEEGGLTPKRLTVLKKTAYQLGLTTPQLQQIFQEIGSGAVKLEEEELAPVFIWVLKGGGWAIAFLFVAVIIMLFIRAPWKGYAAKKGKKVPTTVATTTSGQPKVSGWWDSVANAKLGFTMFDLQKELPKEHRRFLDSLGSKTEASRLDAYQKLPTQAAEIVGNPQALGLLDKFVAEAYALEPAEGNAAGMRKMFVSLVPRDNAVFPATYKADDLDGAFWAVQAALSALTNKAAKEDRAKQLAQDLGMALGTTVDLKAKDLKERLDKALAKRLYRNLGPTATKSPKSIQQVLLLREHLHKKHEKVQEKLLEREYFEQVDVDLIVAAASDSSAPWAKMFPILRSALFTKDLTTQLKILDMYDKADSALANKLDDVLSKQWKIFKDKDKDQSAKVQLAREQVLASAPPGAKGLAKPRPTQLVGLAQYALNNSQATADQTPEILQETLRLAHVSTIASAMGNKEKGNAKFDDLAGRVPGIDGKELAAITGLAGGGAAAVSGTIAVDGELTMKDTELGRPGVFLKKHKFRLKAKKDYLVMAESKAFDISLRIEDQLNKKLAEDDDSGGDKNAKLTFSPPIDGQYIFIVTASGAFGKRTGTYSLKIQEGLLAKNPDSKQGDNKSNVIVPLDPDVLKGLRDKNSKNRLRALQNVTQKLGADLAPSDADQMARFLLKAWKKEDAEEIAANLGNLNQSRNLLLAMAEIITLGEVADAPQENIEKVVGNLVGEPVQLGKDDNWRLRCRKVLLLRALEGGSSGGPDTAQDTAESLRELYKDQAAMLGADPAALAAMLTKTSQPLAALINHLAPQLTAKAASEDKEFLSLVPNYLQAAQFAAQNDLEHVGLLQRIWARVMVIYVAQQNPAYSKEARKVLEDLKELDRQTTDPLLQLRAGEEKILRLWLFVHGLKG